MYSESVTYICHRCICCFSWIPLPLPQSSQNKVLNGLLRRCCHLGVSIFAAKCGCLLSANCCLLVAESRSLGRSMGLMSPYCTRFFARVNTYRPPHSGHSAGLNDVHLLKAISFKSFQPHSSWVSYNSDKIRRILTGIKCLRHCSY